jgi:uncharacterized lipoprotein YddW (UPF0748 family)
MRGVWIPEGSHCDVLKTKGGIREALDLLQELGFNTVFPAVWNRGATAFPSAVMQSFGFDVQDRQYAGFDPLEEIVQAGKARGMAVIPWFEYGFASSANVNKDKILQVKPAWAARDPNGAPCRHGHLFWLNSLHPEVQSFLSELVLEVVRNYAVTGIQGDDRLPAMPRHSGYDAYSLSLFREYSGESAPPAIGNATWAVYRCDQMTQYLSRLVQAIKAINPDCLISMAPAPMPYGKKELMQDSHQWLEANLVDWLHPQIYRKHASSYCRDLKIMLSHWSVKHRAKLAPGLTLRWNQYPVSPRDLLKMMAENRRLALGGDVLFHYGWLAGQTAATLKALRGQPDPHDKA